jgi:hypothetical protein
MTHKFSGFQTFVGRTYKVVVMGDVLGHEGTASRNLDICISVETSSHVCILDRRLEEKYNV